jgi:hypothetical protein
MRGSGQIAMAGQRSLSGRTGVRIFENTAVGVGVGPSIAADARAGIVATE